MAVITKTFTTLHAGSIVGVSINYDITATSFLGSLFLDIMYQGTQVLSRIISSSVGNDKVAHFTFARGIDTFSADETITVRLRASVPFVGSVFINQVVVTLEVYYDD